MSRFLFYSHDSFGLGHLRRTLALARAVTERDDESSALILTGSTVASSYRLPPRVDTVKLPALTKGEDGGYRSLRLPIELDHLQRLRSSLAFSAATSFDPDVLVVDKTPLGLGGELVATLDALNVLGRTKMVLGLRDIDDSPGKVRREWQGRGIEEALSSYYSAVLVYGPESTMDALDILGWRLPGLPIHHVGYVGAPLPETPPPDLAADYVLVTVGGGGDGLHVLKSYAAALRERSLGRPSVVVTGPMMEDQDLERVHRLTSGLHVRVLEFRPDMEAVIAGARAVVSMAGYNTVAELLRARKPALLVPRVRPRQEQLVRARAVADAGLAEMLHPDELTPATMRAALDRLLAESSPRSASQNLNGAARAAHVLHELAAASPRLATLA